MTSKDVPEQDMAAHAEQAEKAEEVRDLEVTEDRQTDAVKGGAWQKQNDPKGITVNHSERILA
jgi:hypothetical protein